MVDAIIFNGPNVRDVNVSGITNVNIIKVDLTPHNITAQIKNNNINSNTLVIINTHGRDDQSLQSRIQLKDQNETWYSTADIFKLFKDMKTSLTVQLFACTANAACTNQAVSQLPAGSLVGFYAPAGTASRMEVSEKLITKTLELKAKGIGKEEILWLTAPLAPTSVAYHHPENGFQSQPLLPSNFIYTSILTQNDLVHEKNKSIKNYNTFLRNNGLTEIELNLVRNSNWFKDTWFMQLVIELTTSGGAYQAAIQYLQNADDILKKHKTSLCGLQALNLIEYFGEWLKINTQPGNTVGEGNDFKIVQGLTPIYLPVPQQNQSGSQSSQALLLSM